MEREKFGVDVIQPTDNKFEKFYKEQWRNLEEQAEKYEQEQKRKKLERELWYKNNKFRRESVAKKVLDLEDKIQYGG